MYVSTGCVLLLGQSVLVISYLEASIHRFSKPNMFFSTAFVGPPVFPWHSAGVSAEARLTSFHITVYFNGIHLAALVRINPVLS